MSASARSSRHTGMSASRGMRVEEVGEVVAGGKILAFAAMVMTRIAVVARGAIDRVGQRGIHGDGDRVAPLGSGQGDRQHAAIAFDPDMLAHRSASRIG